MDKQPYTKKDYKISRWLVVANYFIWGGVVYVLDMLYMFIFIVIFCELFLYHKRQMLKKC